MTNKLSGWEIGTSPDDMYLGSATSMCIDFVAVHQSSLCSRLSQTECREIRQRRHLSSMGQYFSEKHSKHRTSVIAKSERSNFLQESLDKH